METENGLTELSEYIDSIIPADARELRRKGCTATELAQMRCDVYNDTQGSLKGYDCKDCNNRGYFAKVNADGFDVRVECKCMAIRKSIKLMNESGMRELLDKKTFDNYLTTAPWRIRAKEQAMQYAERTDSTWLFFSGQNGSGKTHLCTAICRRLMERGLSVRYMLWTAIMKRMEAARFSDEKYDRIIMEIAEPDVLYIDDFLKCANGKKGKSKPSDAALEIAYDIINVRYRWSSKRTIISSEFFDYELTEFDQALGSRIAEMSTGCKIQIAEDESRNYRLNPEKEERNV